MFAIINIAGKQFKVEEGDQLKVPHLSTEVGKSLVFDKVLLTNDNSNVELGSPIPVSYTHLTLPTSYAV